MIKTVADLLEAFLSREKAVLAARRSVRHGPTIGAMYEGLTRHALSRVVPLNAPLFVSTGFAEGKGGKQSLQLDCILSTSAGETIPYTESRVVPVEDVVAVVEVKKTLGLGSIVDGYSNLHSVAELEPNKPPPFPRSALKSAFQHVTGFAFPENPRDLPAPLYEVYRYLLREALTPVRVLLGYEGFRTARGLRKAVTRQVTQLVGRAGVHGPYTLPTLIASSRHAVAKMNGLPWGAPDTDDGRIAILASSGGLSPAG